MKQPSYSSETFVTSDKQSGSHGSSGIPRRKYYYQEVCTRLRLHQDLMSQATPHEAANGEQGVPGCHRPNMPPVLDRATASPPLSMISQELLANYARLKEAEAQRNALREQIVAMLQAGMPVQPGPLGATLRQVTTRNFTVANLTELLGAERVAQLRDRITPKEQTHLIVERQLP